VDNRKRVGPDTGTFAAVTRVAVLLEQCLAPVPGGTGRYSAEIAAALAATAPAGATVSGWTAWHRDVTAARVEGVAGPRRLPLPRRLLVAAWQRRQGPSPRGDIVHAPTPLAPPRRGRPLVVTVHDTVPWTHPETLTPRGAAWHRLAVGQAARYADRIVVPTQAVADDLNRHVAIPTNRLVVIGEGATRALSPPAGLTTAGAPGDGVVGTESGDGEAAERVVRRLELPDAYVLSLATLEPRKGLDVLLAALAERTAPDLPLLVVGQPGWGGVDPLAEAARLGVPAGRVRVLGRLPDADLATVLARATVLAAPSRAEGFGLPVLEAMAAGVPVVSSDAPALVEVGGGATLVVPRDDPAALAGALAEIATDAGLRAKLAAAGQQRAQAYTWEGAARTLWDLYESLV
jgi:glycosyltransferase involved in cell wall biosynthesis